MPVDIMSCSLPLCCVMGTCAYEVFHWQRVFQEKHKNRLPNGVYDDKHWDSPNKRESELIDTKLNDEDYENVHENYDKTSSCVWDPVIGGFQGKYYFHNMGVHSIFQM